MPGLIHIMISMLFSVFLIKVSKNEFNVRHALIFSINSHFGPDLFGMLPYYGEGSELYYFIHGYGWIFVAFVVAIPWYLVNHMSLSYKPFKIAVRSHQDSIIIPYIQVYCLVAAGGIFHQFIDIIGHPPLIDYSAAGGIIHWGGVWFGGDNWFDMNTILGTGMFPCGNTFGFSAANIFLLLVIPVLAIVGLFIMPRNEGKNFPKLAYLLTAYYTLPLLVAYFIPDSQLFALNNPDANYFGYGETTGHYPSTFYLTGGEADLGVIIFMLMFFFVPLTLLYWGYRGLPNLGKKVKKNEKTEEIPEIYDDMLNA